jgi:DnaJ-class molecular chaperone
MHANQTAFSTQNTRLVIMMNEKRNYCYWCATKLKECGVCHGTGKYKEHECYPCKGTGILCRTHGADWE